MADFIARTASSYPRLTDPVAAKQVLDRYCWIDDLKVNIECDKEDGQWHLVLSGDGWPDAFRIPDGLM